MADLMNAIVSLSKRRGFIYPSSEIYGGLANAYEFGPVGIELKKNITDAWWRNFIHRRRDMVGLDSSIILHPKVWEASGHVASFSDPMIDCKNCRRRKRADHLIEEFFEAKGESKQVEGLPVEEMDRIIQEDHIPCPYCGEFSWTPVRKFNLLFETSIGIVPESESKAYLRGETAQGIFVAFRNVLDSTRVKLPFGIGQVGKSFRNEITLGNFIFRTLEFEQGEIEYFFDPEKTAWEPLFEQWQQQMWAFITQQLGVKEENLRWREHTDEERSHYSKRTVDLDYKFPFGFKELWGLAYRTDYDLSQHQKYSGQDLSVIDPENPQRRFVPHVIEPAVGINRMVLMVLLDAYHEDTERNRVVLRLKPSLAPYKVAIFPLVKNKEEIVGKAQEIFDLCADRFHTAWDDRGNIGKRYLSQDEIGTPFCVTVDYQTLEDGTVTVRHRDTAEQERVSIGDLVGYLENGLV